MDDEPAEEKDYPLSPAKMSKTPSWIMLGFVLGAFFVWMLPRDAEPAAASAAAPAAIRLTAAAGPARTALTTITTIEAVFEVWGQYATWDNDLTEVALWNSETKSFSECYEVRRTRDAFYYRSIPRLTRLVIRHGKPLPDSPLQFTETEEQYREWREHGRSETSSQESEPRGIPEIRTTIMFKPVYYLKSPPIPRLDPPPLSSTLTLTPGAGKASETR